MEREGDVTTTETCQEMDMGKLALVDGGLRDCECGFGVDEVEVVVVVVYGGEVGNMWLRRGICWMRLRCYTTGQIR